MNSMAIFLLNVICSVQMSNWECEKEDSRYKDDSKCISDTMGDGQEKWKSPHLGAGPGLVKMKGMWYPAIFLSMEANKFEKIETFQAREDDIWLSSYPKSGTSWLQQIVYLLVYGENHTSTANLTSDKRFPYLEGLMPIMDKLAEMPSPRLIKTHLPYDLLPQSVITNKSKVIYISRNVKDVSVSMYHFHQLVTNIDYKGTFLQFCDEFIQGKVFYSSWWDHVIGYWKHRMDNNILFLKYEDLHKDAPKEIRKVAEFLNIEVQDDFVSRIAEVSTFDVMKDNPKVNYSWNEERGLFKKDHTTKFLRKGKVGDWKTYYSNEMSSEVDSICDSKLNSLELHFDYDLGDSTYT